MTLTRCREANGNECFHLMTSAAGPSLIASQGDEHILSRTHSPHFTSHRASQPQPQRCSRRCDKETLSFKQRSCSLTICQSRESEIKKMKKKWNFGLKRIDKCRTHSLADSHRYLAQATKLRNCKAKIPTELMTSPALTRQNQFQLAPTERHRYSKVLATRMHFPWRLVGSNRLLLRLACFTQMLMSGCKTREKPVGLSCYIKH